MINQGKRLHAREDWKMAVTLAEIAKVAGVSVSTVSRVLNNNGHAISESTRQRIQEVADSMGYKPNLLARGLQAQRTFTVGVIVDNISSPFASPIVRGIQDRLKRERFTATIVNSDLDPEVEMDAIHTLLGYSVDGIIFVDTWLHSGTTIPPLAGKPYVLVNRIFNSSDQNFVDPDDFYGAQIATQHLIDLGHQRIAYINGPETWKASIMRLAGYRQTLEEHGILFDPLLVRPATGPSSKGMPPRRNCSRWNSGPQPFSRGMTPWRWA
jgi:LacI family transcriptional regulator